MIGLTELEEYLGISVGEGPAFLVELEAGAVALVESYTGRYFREEAEVVEVLYGKGRPRLWLSEEPVASPVPTVEERAYPGADATAIIDTASDGFLIRGMSLVRKAGLVWYKGYEYTVTFTRGYELRDPAGAIADVAAPEDIRQVVKQIVAAWFGGGKPAEAATALTSEKIGDYSYTKGQGTGPLADPIASIPGVRATLNAWRRKLVR